jgi:hypothetical protein
VKQEPTMPVNAPASILEPPPEQDIHVVRGDRFVMSIGFSDLPDAATIAVQNRLRLAIRRQQSDNQNNIIAVNAALEVDPDDTINGIDIDIMGTFTLTPAQTSSLPAAGAYYFVEWTDLVGGSNTRVVQGRVRTGD